MDMRLRRLVLMPEVKNVLSLDYIQRVVRDAGGRTKDLFSQHCEQVVLYMTQVLDFLLKFYLECDLAELPCLPAQGV